MKNNKHRNKMSKGFSMIELIVTVVIIGIITFMVVPNLMKTKKSAELNETIIRVQALNMAIAALSMSESFHGAEKIWNQVKDPADPTKTNNNRYDLIKDNLSEAGPTLDTYISSPYEATMPDTIRKKVILKVRDKGGVLRVIPYD